MKEFLKRSRVIVASYEFIFIRIKKLIKMMLFIRNRLMKIC